MSAATNTVYQDAKGPEAFAVDISPSLTVPDLTAVTAAELAVTTHAGSFTWDVAISNQTATTLRLTHVFASDGSDVATPGNVRVTALLTTMEGIRRTVPCVLIVLPL